MKQLRYSELQCVCVEERMECLDFHIFLLDLKHMRCPNWVVSHLLGWAWVYSKKPQEASIAPLQGCDMGRMLLICSLW